MKSLYTTLFLILVILSSAQINFQVTDLDNANAVLNDGGIITKSTTALGLEFPHHIAIRNTSANTVTISVRKYEEVINTITVSDKAAAYFCFNTFCYIPVVMNATTSLTAGQSFSLIPKLDEASAVGYSQIRYRITEGTDNLSVTLKYNAPASVKENIQTFGAISNVYPNPSNSNSFLDIYSNTEINKVDVKIYNSLGSIVSSKSVGVTKGKNTIEFETENLESGIYFTTISQGKNQITKKIIISN